MQKRSMHVLLTLKKRVNTFLKQALDALVVSQYDIDVQYPVSTIKSLYEDSEVCVRVNRKRLNLSKCAGTMTRLLSFSHRRVKNCESGGGVKIGDCAVQRMVFADSFELVNSTQTHCSDACCDAVMTACALQP